MMIILAYMRFQRIRFELYSTEHELPKIRSLERLPCLEYAVLHCVKSVRIWSYYGPHFPAFGLNMERYGVSGKYGPE